MMQCLVSIGQIGWLVLVSVVAAIGERGSGKGMQQSFAPAGVQEWDRQPALYVLWF
jgi:hypothetical protein